MCIKSLNNLLISYTVLRIRLSSKLSSNVTKSQCNIPLRHILHIFLKICTQGMEKLVECSRPYASKTVNRYDSGILSAYAILSTY